MFRVGSRLSSLCCGLVLACSLVQTVSATYGALMLDQYNFDMVRKVAMFFIGLMYSLVDYLALVCSCCSDRFQVVDGTRTGIPSLFTSLLVCVVPKSACLCAATCVLVVQSL